MSHNDDGCMHSGHLLLRTFGAVEATQSCVMHDNMHGMLVNDNCSLLQLQGSAHDML